MSRPRGKTQTACWYCREVGHQKKDCPYRACYTCGEQGHKAAECRADFCDLCEMHGHVASACELFRDMGAHPPTPTKSQVEAEEARLWDEENPNTREKIAAWRDGVPEGQQPEEDVKSEYLGSGFSSAGGEKSEDGQVVEDASADMEV